MRRLIRFATALMLGTLMMVGPVGAQQPVVFYSSVDSVAGASSTTTDSPCFLVKYVGTTAGKPTVETAAGGDVTFKLAGSADTTTGSPNLDGIFDLSTPAAAVDTVGELVNLINTTGSNWRAVLVSCLASDLTDNHLAALSATDASSPKGVAMNQDAAVASATSIFSAQVALLPGDASTNISFFLSGSAIGSPSGSNKINPNPFEKHQQFVQAAREKITSAGTIGLAELLAVKRTYDSLGKVSEVVRVLWSETGAATTVEKSKDFTSGPLVAAQGELVIWRQRTDTDLTAVSIGVNGYSVPRK